MYVFIVVLYLLCYVVVVSLFEFMLISIMRYL